MTDNRQDEPKSSHWAPGQLSEASPLPHSTDMKEQGGAGDGMVHSSNGIPFRETAGRAYGERSLQESHPTSKENGINGEMPSGDSETAGKDVYSSNTIIYNVCLGSVHIAFFININRIRQGYSHICIFPI